MHVQLASAVILTTLLVAPRRATPKRVTNSGPSVETAHRSIPRFQTLRTRRSGNAWGCEHLRGTKARVSSSRGRGCRDPRSFSFAFGQSPQLLNARTDASRQGIGTGFVIQDYGLILTTSMSSKMLMSLRQPSPAPMAQKKNWRRRFLVLLRNTMWR